MLDPVGTSLYRRLWRGGVSESELKSRVYYSRSEIGGIRELLLSSHSDPSSICCPYSSEHELILRSWKLFGLENLNVIFFTWF